MMSFCLGHAVFIEMPLEAQVQSIVRHLARLPQLCQHPTVDKRTQLSTRCARSQVTFPSAQYRRHNLRN